MPVKLDSTRFPLLASFANLASKRWKNDIGSRWTPAQTEWFLNFPGADKFIDSGAFTFRKKGVEPPIEDYYTFVKQYDKNIWGYIAMDVPGNPKKSIANLKRMWDDGYEPVPVHVVGNTIEWMDELYEHSNFICIASLGLAERITEKNKRYLAMKMKWADGRPVHWLGYTNEGMIRTFHPYSVDSSSWASGVIYGSAMLYFGNGVRFQVRVQEFRNRKLPKQLVKYEQEFLRMLSFLNISTRDIFNPEKWTGWKVSNPALMLSVYSWIQYVRELYERFGTKHFIAVTTPQNVSPIVYLLNMLEGYDYPCDAPGTSKLFIR